MLLLGDFICKINLKDPFFCGSIVKKLPDICQVLMESHVIGIFMSMLRTFFSAKSFHEINESSDIFIAETLYKDYIISRRYALDGSFSRGTTNYSGYVDIPASELWIFSQHAKATLDPTSTLEFLGVLVGSQNMTLYLPQEKVEKTKTQCKELLETSLATFRELNTLIGRLSSTAVALLLVTLQYRALQHQQIQGMISKYFLEVQVSPSK